MNTPARNAGLDTLRAAAILLVFMYHYMVFVSHEPTFGWLSTVGWVGVDLFFVLSGYLIGNQLFRGLAQGQRLSAGAFCARRALRTLPAFYVVLALYFLFPAALGGKEPPPLWRFLSFTQNINLMPGTAFSHAWSLCIEEQFYLLLPAVLLLGLHLGATRRQAWLALGLLTVLAIAWRSLLWLQYGREALGEIRGYYPNVYYASLCRLDEFLPGIAVALLKHGHPQAWARLMAQGNRLLLAGGAAVALMFYLAANHYYIDGYGYGYFMSGFGYSLLAMAFALLVAAALSPQCALQRLRVPGAAALAAWSYSVYLSHKPIAHLVQAQLPEGSDPGLVLLAVCGACLAGGWLLYRAVERPFLNLRDRHAPDLFAPQPAGTPPALPVRDGS